jgi:hypothetical protein
VVHHAAVVDDPQRRRPDMGPAKRVLAGGANCRSEVSLPNPTLLSIYDKKGNFRPQVKVDLAERSFSFTLFCTC